MKAHPDGTAAAAWLVIILMAMGIATVIGADVWAIVTHC